MSNREGEIPRQETEGSGSRLNLLTNFEETLQAMAEIEGHGWLEMQKREAPHGQNINGALEQLKKWPDEASNPELKDTILIVVNGSGGGLRWGVTHSGEVKFSGFHVASGSQGQEQLEKAKALGFNIY